MFLSYVFESTLVISWSTQRLPSCTWTFPYRRKHTGWLSTSLVTRWRLQQTSTQPHPNLRHKTNYIIHYHNFKVVLGNGVASHQRPSSFIVWSITIVEELPQLQHWSTYSCKTKILKKVSLSWWTTQSLVSLFYLYVYLFFYVLMYWFIHCR